MSDPNPEETPEARGPELADVRTPERIPPSEREVFEGRIIELKEEIQKRDEEIAALKLEIENLKKQPKKKSLADRFAPL